MVGNKSAEGNPGTEKRYLKAQMIILAWSQSTSSVA